MHVNDVVNKKKWKGNKIMERICILAFLGINSWKDIHTREVSLFVNWCIWNCGNGKSMFSWNCECESGMECLYGAAVIGLSIISKGAVGMGDGLFISVALGQYCL